MDFISFSPQLPPSPNINANQLQLCIFIAEVFIVDTGVRPSAKQLPPAPPCCQGARGVVLPRRRRPPHAPAMLGGHWDVLHPSSLPLLPLSHRFWKGEFRDSF